MALPIRDENRPRLNLTERWRRSKGGAFPFKKHFEEPVHRTEMPLIVVSTFDYQSLLQSLRKVCTYLFDTYNFKNHSAWLKVFELCCMLVHNFPRFLYDYQDSDAKICSHWNKPLQFKKVLLEASIEEFKHKVVVEKNHLEKIEKKIYIAFSAGHESEAIKNIDTTGSMLGLLLQLPKKQRNRPFTYKVNLDDSLIWHKFRLVKIFQNRSKLLEKTHQKFSDCN